VPLASGSKQRAEWEKEVVMAYRCAVPVLFEYAPAWIWVLGCAALAGLYVLSWPRRKAAGLGRGLRYLVLRWFHSLVWVLLAVSISLHTVPSPAVHTAGKVLAVLALFTYLAFAAALLVPRRRA
jgi:hypothetical protein